MALEMGVDQFEVTEGLNDSAKFTEALAALVLQKLAEPAARIDSV